MYMYIISDSMIFIQILDYEPCCKILLLSPFSQPLLRGRSIGSSLGSYKGSSGHTGSLSSPRHYPQQFGTPLRSQGPDSKLDRTPARLGNILGATEFLKLQSLVSSSSVRFKCSLSIEISPLCEVGAGAKLIGWPFNFHCSLISGLLASPCELRGGVWALFSNSSW